MATTQITIRVDRVEGNYRENEIALRRELRWNEDVIAGWDERRRGHIAEIMEELRRMTRSIGFHYGWGEEEEEENERLQRGLPLMIIRLEALAKRCRDMAGKAQWNGYEKGQLEGRAQVAEQVVEDLKLIARGSL